MTFTDAARRLTSMLARSGMRGLLDGSVLQGRTPRASGEASTRGASTRRRLTRTTSRVGERQRRPSTDNLPVEHAQHHSATHPYRGDWTRPLPATAYAPKPDGRPDPGEVVWAWVPYEENHAQGKDRPALVVARHPDLVDVVLALPLTSKDHDRDAAQEARAGRHWMDVGSGAWDSRGRRSEVRLDRVLQLDVPTIRREGATIDEATFDAVIAAARSF